jgi:MFS family permease
MRGTSLAVAASPAEERPWRRAALVLPLLSSGALMALMYTALSSVLSEMALHLGPAGEGAFLAQMFMTLPSAGMMLGGLVSAWAVGRFGARWLLLASLALFGLCGTTGLWSVGSQTLLVSRLFLGLAAAGIATSATTLLAENFEEVARRKLIGYQSSLGAVAGLASTLLAGIVGAHMGWRAPFSFYAVAWVLLVSAFVGLPRRQPRPASVPDNGVSSSVGLPWRSLAPVYLMCVPLYAAVFMTTAQVPFLLHDDGVSDPVVQSWVLAMAALLNAVGASQYGRIRSRIGAGCTFALSLGLMAVGQAVLGLSHIPLLSGLGCAVAGIGAGLAVPHVPNMVLERVQGHARGRALGLMYTALYLGSFCNPVFVAPLAAWLGRHGALLVSAGLLCFGSALVLGRHRSAGPASS